jgi:hypothetical protein
LTQRTRGSTRRGLVDGKSEPWGVVADLPKWERQASRMLADLGLDATSQARIDELEARQEAMVSLAEAGHMVADFAKRLMSAAHVALEVVLEAAAPEQAAEIRARGPRCCLPTAETGLSCCCGTGKRERVTAVRIHDSCGAAKGAQLDPRSYRGTSRCFTCMALLE